MGTAIFRPSFRPYVAPPPQRSRQTVLADLVRTEPTDRAGRLILEWLTADAARIGPPA